MKLYHGTGVLEEFTVPNSPFWLTTNFKRAERYALRNWIGERRVMVFTYNENARLFNYKSETALEQETNQRFEREDGSRYRAITKALKDLRWDGLVEENNYCFFYPEIHLRLINTHYLDSIDHV